MCRCGDVLCQFGGTEGYHRWKSEGWRSLGEDFQDRQADRVLAQGRRQGGEGVEDAHVKIMWWAKLPKKTTVVDGSQHLQLANVIAVWHHRGRSAPWLYSRLEEFENRVEDTCNSVSFLASGTAVIGSSSRRKSISQAVACICVRTLIWKQTDCIDLARSQNVLVFQSSSSLLSRIWCRYG